MLSERQILECELLVVQCRRGDREAFASIVRMWEQALFYYLRRLLKSEEDAWELLQETWLKTYRSLPTLRDPRTLPSFLYTTARNAAISRMRNADFGSVTISAFDETIGVNGDDVTAFDNAEQVHRALDRLSLQHREVLTLFFLEDLSLDEMATLLSIPLGTVKSRLHYAKLAIHKIISEGESHVE